MQPFVRWTVTSIAVFAAIPAVAGTIGFLDTERAIRTVREGQRQYQILDAWANQRSDEVDAIQSRVAELTQRLNSQQDVASPEAVRQLEKELLQAQRDFEDAGRALKSDYEKKRRELLDPVARRVRTVASEYAESKGIDAIFMLETQPLVYIAESVIVTDAVIQIYNERFPVD
jgi:Skp family chaperone for outer membrane proteins